MSRTLYDDKFVFHKTTKTDSFIKDMKLKIFDNLVKRRFKQKDVENKKIFLVPNGRNDITDLEEWLHLMMER
jgi:hypothetical protein